MSSTASLVRGRGLSTWLVLQRSRYAFTVQQARAWSIFSGGEKRQLQKMKEQAELRPHDAEAQAALLQSMNKSTNSNAYEVLRHVDSGRYAVNETVAKEYVKALVSTGSIDRVKFPLTLNSEIFPGVQGAAPSTVAAVGSAPSATGFAGLMGGALQRNQTAGAAIANGNANTPIQVAISPPTTREQIWRLVRQLAAGLLILGFVGALLEERGGMRGMGLIGEAHAEPEGGDTKTFDDVKGCDEAKEELAEVVEFLRSPEKFSRLGGKMPKGLLLVGPPGTGKTLLARAVAGEAERPFFYASGSEFEEMFVGVGARRIRELFSAAKKNAPCIIFLDEIDAVGGKRSPKDHSYSKMTLNQLLVELDGFSHSNGVIVIGATNFAQSLDDALVRPGRFDRHVHIPNPDVRGREEILEVHTQGMPLGPDVDLNVVARSTPGFSGAELANLTNTAAIKAAGEGGDEVLMHHFDYAKDRIMMGSERKKHSLSKECLENTAYHEGGHALVAIATPGAMPVYKATIVPRNQALGMVTQLPESDIVSLSRKQLRARMDVAMAGHAAEEIMFGLDNVTTGASNDFEVATRYAEHMVTKYGMSEKLGKVCYDKESESPETRARIEAEVKRLIDESYERVFNLLKSRKDQLHNIARALLKYETLTGEQVKLAADGALSIETAS